MHWNSKYACAHRIAWLLTFGLIPEGVFVCHHCDNPSCCNPAHLFLGTAMDNNRDRLKKGGYKRGEESPVAKLSYSVANSIRQEYAQGNVGARPLARKYGVSRASIRLILRGKTWCPVGAQVADALRAGRIPPIDG